MIFDAPAYLVFAPLVAAGAAFLTWVARRRRIRLAGYWSEELKRAARANGRWGPVGLGAVVLLLGIVLAGPRGGRTEITTETRALSLVMVVDISRSMLAEDVSPSRLGRAVREARRLVLDLAGDRIGLIAFAGRSYILSPLTIDGGAITLQLDALDPDLVSQGGTSLAAALVQGSELLGASTEIADRVLVVFSDGETHDSMGPVTRAAGKLAENNVRLVMVAEGGNEPARIPVRDSSGNLLEYQRSRDGEIIETRRRDNILQEIVEAADGTIIPAELSDQAGAVYDLTRAFKRNPTAETRTADLFPLGWIPLLVAGLLLLGQTFARRGASLLALLLGLGLPAWLEGQQIGPAEQAVNDGELRKATRAYLELARAGWAQDTSYYNAGTAALMVGELEAATVPLEQAAGSLDPDLRFRSLYNLGVAALKLARSDSTRREAFYEVAARYLKDALLLEPSSEDAKWNLELALSEQPPPTSGGGGGGGGQPPPPTGGQPPPEARPDPAPGGLTQSQAEQILNSAEREERATRSEQLERRRGRGTGGGKDW